MHKDSCIYSVTDTVFLNHITIPMPLQKPILAVFALYMGFLIPASFAQELPTFLEGAWKIQDREVYEVWKINDDGSMSGYSYRIREGVETITEYLDLRGEGGNTIYTATVLDQNEGRGIEFVLSRPDENTWVFENPEHDFPKKILYRKNSETEVFVEVSDGGNRGFSFLMHRYLGEK